MPDEVGLRLERYPRNHALAAVTTPPVYTPADAALRAKSDAK